MPDITARYPQPGSADLIVKLEHPGGAPIPAAHTVIFQPFRVEELKLLDKSLHDIRRDVFELQIFFDGYRQRGHKTGNRDLMVKYLSADFIDQLIFLTTDYAD